MNQAVLDLPGTAALPVEVRNALSKEAFEESMHPFGKPVIVTGTMASWPAMRKWTFAWFKERYGNDFVEVTDALYDAEQWAQVRLSEYIDYIETPADTRLKRLEQERQLPAPFYAYGYKPFRWHPELLDDFSVPEVLEDWTPHFSRLFKYAHFPNWQGWLFLTPQGAKTKLHQDPGATILWHAQIYGRKRCLLFSPRDSGYLYDGAVDPLHPDLEHFPLYKFAQPFECVLEPGTMLFLPSNWWHHVVALEPSITLSYNVVNRVNFGYYVQDRHGRRLNRWVARLPIEPRQRVIRKALGALRIKLSRKFRKLG